MFYRITLNFNVATYLMLDLLCLKIFLRKRDAIHSILTIALLIAILASVNSIMSFLNAQIETLAGLSEPTRKYIIVGESSLSGGRLEPQLADRLRLLKYLDNVLSEKLFWSNVTFGLMRLENLVRGVDNVGEFLRLRRAYLNGSAARGMNEAVIGEIIANAYSISIGAEACLAYNAKSAKFIITGIFSTQTELDSEIIVPMEAAFNLTGEERVSLIEFSLKKSVNVEEALKEISGLLPEDARIIQVQQLILFAKQINAQTLNFLGFWSLSVYAVIASASYVIAARLVDESIYEIQMIRALGARRGRLFTLILLYTVTVAALGSILGIAIGLVGTQIISAALSWLTLSVRITPLLELPQILQILSIAIPSAATGCLYPAYRAAKVKYAEKLL